MLYNLWKEFLNYYNFRVIQFLLIFQKFVFPEVLGCKSQNCVQLFLVQNYNRKFMSKNREEYKMYLLIESNSCLSIHNKILLYKQVLKQIWSLGCKTKSKIHFIYIYIYTHITLLAVYIVGAPRYIGNTDLHWDDNKIEVI